MQRGGAIVWWPCCGGSQRRGGAASAEGVARHLSEEEGIVTMGIVTMKVVTMVYNKKLVLNEISAKCL